MIALLLPHASFSSQIFWLQSHSITLAEKKTVNYERELIRIQQSHGTWHGTPNFNRSRDAYFIALRRKDNAKKILS